MFIIVSLWEVQVVVEMAWDIPTDKVVTMDMWMSSASMASNKFLKDRCSFDTV